MIEISDDYMRQQLATAKEYCLIILRRTPAAKDHPGLDKILWEHVRRNMALSASGELPVVCPIRDRSDVAGVGIFDTSGERVREIMEGDPGVAAGIFSYELHACRGFPGSELR